MTEIRKVWKDSSLSACMQEKAAVYFLVETRLWWYCTCTFVLVSHSWDGSEVVSGCHIIICSSYSHAFLLTPHINIELRFYEKPPGTLRNLREEEGMVYGLLDGKVKSGNSRREQNRPHQALHIPRTGTVLLRKYTPVFHFFLWTLFLAASHLLGCSETLCRKKESRSLQEQKVFHQPCILKAAFSRPQQDNSTGAQSLSKYKRIC